MEQLLKDIGAYIEFLRGVGLYITVHGDISEYMYRLSKYNLHDNPFCVLVKSDDLAWQRCIQSQCKILSKPRNEPFWGMCHAGLEEYIFPVSGTKTFVCVSGYAVNQAEAVKRILAISREFFLEKQKLLEVYQTKLTHTKPELQDLCAVVNPLCHMLFLLNQSRELDFDQSGHHIYNRAMIYIERNFAQPVCLSDIAAYCSCSVSALCHIFKNSSGSTIKGYITSLRMKNAKNLLLNSTLSINSIAALSGYSDPDYFSVVFKKYFACQPTQYRRAHSEKSDGSDKA